MSITRKSLIEDFGFNGDSHFLTKRINKKVEEAKYLLVHDNRLFYDGEVLIHLDYIKLSELGPILNRICTSISKKGQYDNR